MGASHKGGEAFSMGGFDTSRHHVYTAITIFHVFVFLNPRIIIFLCTTISNFFLSTHYTNIKRKQFNIYNDK